MLLLCSLLCVFLSLSTCSSWLRALTGVECLLQLLLSKYASSFLPSRAPHTCVTALDCHECSLPLGWNWPSASSADLLEPHSRETREAFSAFLTENGAVTLTSAHDWVLIWATAWIKGRHVLYKKTDSHQYVVWTNQTSHSILRFKNKNVPEIYLIHL